VGALDYARAEPRTICGRTQGVATHSEHQHPADHRNDVLRAADWLLAHLREMGMTAELNPLNGGHPMVYASGYRTEPAHGPLLRAL